MKPTSNQIVKFETLYGEWANLPNGYYMLMMGDGVINGRKRAPKRVSPTWIAKNIVA